MILSWLGESRYSNVTVSDSLYLEDATSLCDFVKRAKESLEKDENVSRPANRGPGSETDNVGKKDRGIRKEVGNGVGRDQLVAVGIISSQPFIEDVREGVLAAPLVGLISSFLLFFVEPITDIGRKERLRFIQKRRWSVSLEAFDEARPPHITYRYYSIRLSSGVHNRVVLANDKPVVDNECKCHEKETRSYNHREDNGVLRLVSGVQPRGREDG